MIDKELEDAIDRATKPASEGGQELCSPLHRCFPPLPTVCFICRGINPDECPMRSVT